ncbi:hypothetical protein ACOALZ_08405 [Nocardiopsis algeriensis]|uniref:hypothetical protein n=1 Tax=Nocardiopsis algeriensis TaxID=1478215 RepID=UPI003B43AF22
MKTTGTAVDAGVRAVLAAPRGHRFSRPAAPLSREQRLLAQMRGNPRVERRLRQGELPLWMHIQAERLAEQGQPVRSTPSPQPARAPRPRPAPDDGPPPPAPEQPVRPKPPLPRRRPHSHRKPSTRWGRLLTAYTLAVGVGAVAQHLVTALY